MPLRTTTVIKGGGEMPQKILPLIPVGATQINDLVSVWRGEEVWTYFVGTFPIYSHKASDQQMFRFVTAQMIESGTCKQIQIIKTFGVSKRSVIRAQEKLRQGGAEAFFTNRRGRRGGTVLNPEVLEKAQQMLDQGFNRKDISEELDVKYDTLRKAINAGRLIESDSTPSTITKSSRTVIDMEAADGMGVACTRVEDRMLTSVGKCAGAEIRFERCLDVPKGGVLCALPTLIANGLLNGAESLLGEIKGYYKTVHILLFLAFMALCRIKTTEKMRGQAPGEFGKMIGLDRIPEVRCLRNKMDELCSGEKAEIWAAHLSKFWMEREPESVGALYIDGHVRVYHGHLTKLPRRYVSRERLCLRGITDYWVSDGAGRPFFVVEKQIDPGLLQTLREDIVPRLLADVPNQPTEQELAGNARRCRFVMVFDREGYSPAFFSEMWRNHRIACLTYHKHPDDSWPVNWFSKQTATLANGEVVEMLLCEMGSLIGSGKNAVWMREVRKLTTSEHQTSIISTAFDLPSTQLAVRMFSRWCQENFFGYMMQHFEIDLLMEYGAIEFPGAETVVNPAWRELDRSRNALQNKLRYRQARFAEMTLNPETENNPATYKKWVAKKAGLLEEIEHYTNDLEVLKEKIKNTKKHIAWDELENQDKFLRLIPGRKRLMDTIRMIAYRAETAMVGLLVGPTVDSPAARRLLQDLFVTEADILPNDETGELKIRVHNASRPAANRELLKLFEKLNESEVIYPGTDLRLVYEIGGHKNEK
jgi:transposase